MARIRLENVTKVFDGSVAAVADLSLDVTDGCFMVIVGPSGCGKTTTLRMIAGLERPTSGNIYIGDALANDMSPKDRDVAMVFQNYALYPHMTVYQNLAFPLKMRNLPSGEIRQKVTEVAALLAVQHLLGRKPGALSGGQRQRVALGRAIVRNPKAFLFDEPLSNIDAKLRAAMRTELKAIHQRLQATCIYVTHDQAEALTLGDTVAVMSEGGLHQVAEAMEIYQKPSNRFVAAFIGSPPMNFFPGRLQFVDDSARFTIGAETIILPQRFNKALADYNSGEMVLGIRPEHLSPEQFAGSPNNAIAADVELIEPLGASTRVRLIAPTGTRFVACLNPDVKLKPTDTVKMHIDTEKIHIFEPGETGKNVTLA
ncbi:MAG: ABC transporter ATP-binding protein [Planctomycetota bacterium]|jgi:multiple sugar transport system ATP-binding protein